MENYKTMMSEKEAQKYVEYIKRIDPNFNNDVFEVMLWERMKSRLNEQTNYMEQTNEK